MTIGKHNRSTAVLIVKIGISRNTKCAIRDGFRRDSHIYTSYKLLCNVLHSDHIIHSVINIRYMISLSLFGFHISISRLTVVSREAKKKQHVHAS